LREADWPFGLGANKDFQMRFVNLVLLVTAFVTGCGIQSAFAQYNMPPGQNSWKADRQQRLDDSADCWPTAGSRDARGRLPARRD
jgi:hypothetical protein